MPKALEDRLASDPVWSELVRIGDQRRIDLYESAISKEMPLLDELSELGIDIHSSWELRHRKKPYPEAIPLILKHLVGPYPVSTRKALAMALGHKWAKPLAWEGLLNVYLNEPNLPQKQVPDEIGATYACPKDQMAVSLTKMASDRELPKLIELISEPRNGACRVFFVKKLARSKNDFARATLCHLKDDPALSEEILACMK